MMEDVNVDNTSLHELNMYCAKVMQNSESTISAANPEKSDEEMVKDVASRLSKINSVKDKIVVKIDEEQETQSGFTSPQESAFMTPSLLSPNPEEEKSSDEGNQPSAPKSPKDENASQVPEKASEPISTPTPEDTGTHPSEAPADGGKNLEKEKETETEAPPTPAETNNQPEPSGGGTQTTIQTEQAHTKNPTPQGGAPEEARKNTEEQIEPQPKEDQTQPNSTPTGSTIKDPTPAQAQNDKENKEVGMQKGGLEDIPNTFQQTTKPLEEHDFFEISGIPITPVMSKSSQLAALKRVMQGQTNAAFLPEPQHMAMYPIKESPLERDDIDMESAFQILEDRILSRVGTMTGKVKDQLEKAQSGITSSLSYISDINGTLDKTLTQINDTIENMSDVIVRKIGDNDQLKMSIAQAIHNQVGPKSELGKSIAKCHTRIDNIQTVLGPMEANLNTWRNSSISISNATPRIATSTYMNLPENTPQQEASPNLGSSSTSSTSMIAPASDSAYVGNVNALKVRKRFGATQRPNINPAQALSEWMSNPQRGDLKTIFSDVGAIDNHLASITIKKSIQDFTRTFGELFE
nr:MAG: hypothetical protein [brine shrimp arlivirus 7]